MILRSRLPRALVLVSLLLGACHDSGGGSSGLLTNFGIGATFLDGNGELWAVGVSEFEEGAQDLNGDRDATDVVVSVLDLADGSLTHLGLARTPLPLLVVGANLIAFGVPESSQGNADLNGDGDPDDTVLHVYDSLTRSTTNTGFAMSFLPPAVGAGAVAFAVSEMDQGGTDLDASGSAVGSVLHVFDARTGLTTNALRNVTSPFTFHGHAFAFTTDEASAAAELNGDGDQDDLAIFQLYDLVIGGIVSVPLAVGGHPLAVGSDDWYVLVNEEAQGDDLNDDLDLEDDVLLAVEPHLGTFLATGITSFPASMGFSDGHRIALVATEGDGLDRNGDGQLNDSYAALIQPGLAPTFIADVPLDLFTPTPFPLALTANRLGFLVSESEVGDLNANGISGENILFAMDATTGGILATGLEALTLHAAGDHLVFLRSETSGSIQEDRNGDDDFDDLVFSWWNTASGALGDTHLAAAGEPVACSNALLVLVDEAAQGVDLNGDGDLLDEAWVWHDLVTGAQVSLGAAAATSATAGLLDDGRGVVLVFEKAQGPAGGTDLNGDGDACDLVLHTFRVP